MRHICRYFAPLVMLLGCLQLANAQSVIDVNFGVGAIQAKAASGGVAADQYGYPYECTPTAANAATCSPSSKLNTAVIGLGANLMLWKHFGVGMEASIQPTKSDYANLYSVPDGAGGSYSAKLQSRTTFYDFNGIYQPYAGKRAAFQLIGGVGGANVKFYYKQSSTSGRLGNSNSSQTFTSANHFQLHAGTGVQLYLTEKVFVRPQFDLRYVPNFEQFGRNLVTQETVWIGYTIGDR